MLIVLCNLSFTGGMLHSARLHSHCRVLTCAGGKLHWVLKCMYTAGVPAVLQGSYTDKIIFVHY